MAYCPKCGVEVEGKKCPLCAYVIKQDIHKAPFGYYVELDKKITIISVKDKKSIYNASTIFFSILISSICLVIDFYNDNTITWAIFPIIAVATLAIITGISIFVKGILKIIFIFLISLIMLFILDIYIPYKNFFLMISLPISGIMSLISFIIVIIIKKSGQRGVNIPGYILIGLAFVTISIDLIIQNFIGNQIKLTWSLITTVSLLPIAFFLLYIHHVLSKKIDLNKVFHT